MAETVVPEGAVRELLGVNVAPRAVGQNLTVLNALGERWIHRDDLLAYLRKNIASTESLVLVRLEREIREVTEART